MPGHIDIYLSDVTADVRVSKRTNASGQEVYYAEGLPLLKPGTWNGNIYTVEDMQAAVNAFTEIQQADSWEPPLRPYHAYDREGKALQHDARETLGWHKALRWDDTAGLLRADVEIVDAQAAADLISGKLRFVSTEVARKAYTSPTTGKTYDTAIVGTAFVDNPAVKGMPWQIVLNAHEFGHGIEAFASWGGRSVDEIRDEVVKTIFPPHGDDTYSPGYCREMYEDYCIVTGPSGEEEKTFKVPFSFDDAGRMTVGQAQEVEAKWVPVSGSTPAVATQAHDIAGMPGNTAGDPGAKGAKSMGLIESLKAKLTALGAKPEDLAEVDQLVAAESEPQTPPAVPAAPAATPTTDPALVQQLEQLSKANEELRGTVETMAAEARRTKASMTVDGWVRGGKLPPALRVPAFALVDALAATTIADITVLSSDEQGAQTTRKASALDLLGEIVTGIAPAINLGAPKGNIRTLGEDVDAEAPRKMTDEELEAMVATVRTK
ncbi:MAG TPA: hypothetical protein PLJ35_05360 [Anaerolineae bacterium]|nr:hypothetical protein [Anaerolineae bacterium]